MDHFCNYLRNVVILDGSVYLKWPLVLVSWSLCWGLLSSALDVFNYVKFAISSGLDNTKDYPLLLPPSSLSSLHGLVFLTSNLVFLLLKDALRMHSVCGSRTQRPYRTPCEGLIVWQGVQHRVDWDHCPSLGAWGQLGAERERGGGKRGGKGASTVIRLSPGVVPRPSLHVHSPFKNQNKYYGCDKPRRPPPWLLQRGRAPNPLARVTRGSA